ncbi:MAG: BlaI/MecI/CopY family transcriptional regulator [Pyrinomonadaceae bacterium]
MATKNLPSPTDAELEILNVLWQRGPSTVREVYDEINRARETGYTTVLKMMQIMAEKGLVRRDEAERAHVYEPARAREQTQRQMLRSLLERAFEGSASNLVMQALSAKRASPQELARIREMLDELEGRRK